MAAATAAPVDVSSQLSRDVYQEQFDFIELIRDVVASLDSQTPDEAVRDQVDLILALVGRDLLKLHALARVVNAKIVGQSSWASIGVKFYRALFTAIDPTLELEVFNDESIMGADIAGMYILEAAVEFTTQPIWISESVNVLEFSLSLLKAFPVGDRGSAIAESLGCSLLEKMATSLYLPFHNNCDTFFPFAYEVVPLLDAADKSMKSSRVTDVLKALKEEDYERTDREKGLLKHLCDILGRSDLYPHHTESNVFEDGESIAAEHTESTAIGHTDSTEAGYVYGRGRLSLIPYEQLKQDIETNWKLFTTTPNWELPAIARLLKSTSEVMKIDAPIWVQTITLDMIQVMVQSKYLFLRRNFQILSFFVFAAAPALDGMAETPQCERLTALLDTLSGHSGVQKAQHRETIDGLRRNLGRSVHSATSKSTVDGSEGKELLAAVAKLNID